MQMNVLSGILRANVMLRHFINSNVKDKDDYSLSGLFLQKNDIIKIKSLISKGAIADVIDEFLMSENCLC